MNSIYSDIPKPAKAVDPEEVYVKKLKLAIDDMARAKESAIKAENYALADQTRLKLSSLQLQLHKMEYQFHSDILTNVITEWHEELIQDISSNLANYHKKTLNVSPVYPLLEPFQSKFVGFINDLSVKYYDSLIKSIVVVLPFSDSGVDLPKSPYGFDFFLRRIPQVSKDSLEFVKSVLTLCVFDALIHLTHNLDSSNMKSETIELLIKHIYCFIRATLFNKSSGVGSRSSVAEKVEKLLFEKTMTRLAVLVGDLSRIDRQFVFSNIFGLIDSSKKPSPEEIIMVLSITRYISCKPNSLKDANEISHLIRELLSQMEKAKKTIIKISILQSLERLVQPLDFTKSLSLELWENSLINEMEDLYRKARKWAKDDDLRPNCLRLMSIILVNSRLDFFTSTIDNHVHQDIFPKNNKLKSYMYACILLILRGRYYLDTLENTRKRCFGSFSKVECFGFIRPFAEESAEVIEIRVREILDRIFVKRKGNIGIENLETCCDIVVQIAVQNVGIALKLISQLLDSRGSADTIAKFEEMHIGINALIIMLDPESGFVSNQKLVNSDLLQRILRDAAYDFESFLPQILYSCDNLAGVAVLGKSSYVLDVNPINLSKKNIKDGENDDILGMLMDMDKASDLNDDVRERSRSGSVTEQDMPRRGSLGDFRSSSMSLNELRPNKDLIDQVESTIRTWYNKCSIHENVDGQQNYDSVIANLYIESTCLPNKKGANRPNLKNDLELVVRLFKSVLKMITLVPTPELVGGQWFIGGYLVHSLEEIAAESSICLQKVFLNNPDMRLSIINGFLNCIKVSPHQDDVSMCTMATQLSLLISLWCSTCTSDSFKVEGDILYRVSCKLDAAMLVLLGRPNSSIRQAALKILADFHFVCETFHPHLNGAGHLPLHIILNQNESLISRYATYAFLEQTMLGDALTPSTSSEINLLSFKDIASSPFAGLFVYYLGELVRLFAIYGRSKSLRHCVKLLKIVAISHMTCATTVTKEFILTYSSYLILLMGMAGVPDKSEIPYALYSMSPQDSTLLTAFKSFLPPILNSDNNWEIQAVCSSVYFLHRNSIHAMLVFLWQSFNELKKDRTNIKLLDNISLFLRFLCQSPEFQFIARDSSSFLTGTTDLLSEFLIMIESSLDDVSFLTIGPVVRIKTAVNYCVIIQRLAEGLSSYKNNPVWGTVFQSKDRDYERFKPLSILYELSREDVEKRQLVWKRNVRKSAVIHMKEWHSIAQELTSVLTSSNTDGLKMARYRQRLMHKICLASEKVLWLGNVFENEAIPQDIVLWMIKIESVGFKVFAPEILQSCENALGTVLAHSYCGTRHSQILGFVEAIFDQNFPRPSKDSRSFLYGESNSEDSMKYIRKIHGFSESLSDIVPLGTRKSAMLRQNLGSLLYCCFYNMLNSSKNVRNRSLLFVRKLFSYFNTDPELDIKLYFSSFMGIFYSNIVHILKKKIINMSQLASDLFSDDAPGFLWEAVRCGRTIQHGETHLCLMPANRWILEIILPWCRFCNFSDISENIVSAEYFRFLLDMAFTVADNKLFEYAQACWIQTAKSPLYGKENTEVLLQVLIQVCGRVDKFRDPALTLATILYNVHPDIVSTFFAGKLSSFSFPWKNTPTVAGITVINDYVNSLHSSVYSTPVDQSNEYPVNCKSSVLFLSELVLNSFNHITAHLPILLNYITLHLPNKLQDNSVSTFLLTNILEGYISMLHQHNKMDEAQHEAVQNRIQELLYLFDSHVFLMSLEDAFGDGKKSDEQVKKMTISDLIETLLAIFEIEYTELRDDFSIETLCWASESFLGAEHSIRAIETFTNLLKGKPQVSSMVENGLITGRLVDQVSALALIENEMSDGFQVESYISQPSPLSPRSPRTSANKKTPTVAGESWKALRENKKLQKGNPSRILLSLLRLHKVWLEKFDETGLLENPLLFWISASLLCFPVDGFEDIYLLALNNCNLYLEKMEAIANYGGGAEQFFSCYEKISSTFPGFQKMLLSSLFESTSEIQKASFKFLLNCWRKLPRNFVDPNAVGTLYTILYTLLLVFSRLLESTSVSELEFCVELAGNLKNVLRIQDSQLNQNLIQCLTLISNKKRNQSIEDLLFACCQSICDIFLTEYAVNIAEFFGYGVKLGATYSNAVLKMVTAIWTLVKSSETMAPNILGPFKQFVKRLPFLSENVNMEQVRNLTLFVLHEGSDNQVVDVDLTSRGKFDAFMNVDLTEGSIRRARELLLKINLTPSHPH